MGEIKNITVHPWFDAFSKVLFRFFFFSGKKPKNKYLSEKPLIDIPAPTDEGPGIGKISIELLTHSWISNLPGSDIVGVPASDIKQIIFFWARLFIISSTFSLSLNLWYEISCFLILKWFKS